MTPAPIYALRDRRADGTLRTIARFNDPREAAAAADALRRAGDQSANAEIVPTVDLFADVQAEGAEATP